LVAAATAGHIRVPDNRIVGGNPIDITEVPYQISLQYNDIHFCGGSILNEKFILTAAHCASGSEANWPYYYVRVGSSLSNEGGQKIKVNPLGIRIHPGYDQDQYWTNDMAILELEESIVLTDSAKPVQLPVLHLEVPINKYAQVSGWGLLSAGGQSPKELHGVKIPINDPRVCEVVYGVDVFNRDTMICAASVTGGESTCQGDSGGPLVYEGVQYGIVSWAVGCAEPRYPTVFSNVPNLRDFIREVVGI